MSLIFLLCTSNMDINNIFLTNQPETHIFRDLPVAREHKEMGDSDGYLSGSTS